MAVTLLVALSACASDSSSVASVPPGAEVINVPDGPKSNETVDCLLPGQVRQLGTQMTYVTERRPIRTTKEDCTIRGGEQVLGKQVNWEDVPEYLTGYSEWAVLYSEQTPNRSNTTKPGLYHLLKDHVPYKESAARYLEQRDREQATRRHVKQLKRFDHRVVREPVA